MPNYVANVLECDGIQNFPIFYKNEETGDRVFDFNLLIPMPPSLSIEDSSRTEDLMEMAENIQKIQNTLHIRLTEDCLMDKQAIDDAVNNIEECIDNIETVYELMAMIKQIDYVRRKWGNTEFSELVQLGNAYLRNTQLYGYPTWYGWCVKNWGTKWNSIETWFPENPNMVAFVTAWDPPIPVLIELSKKYPLETFRLWFADEDVGRGTGVITFQNGEMNEKRYATGSKKALETYRYYTVGWKSAENNIESVFSKI